MSTDPCPLSLRRSMRNSEGLRDQGPGVRGRGKRAEGRGHRAQGTGQSGTKFALLPGMGIGRQAMQYGQRRIARKMLRAVPWLGGIVALVTVGQAIRRK